MKRRGQSGSKKAWRRELKHRARLAKWFDDNARLGLAHLNETWGLRRPRSGSAPRWKGGSP